MCCECWEDEEEGDDAERTPAEVEALRLAADQSASERMTPARTPEEQVSRDLAHAAERLQQRLARALYEPGRQQPRLVGLSKWLGV